MPATTTAIEIARAQFAFTVMFHIIFPAFSIGLASYLAVLEGLWLWTRRPVYMRVFDYWKTIFAVVFGMGVVSGVVMSYQFGTNWPVFADKTGPIIGPLMGYEVLSAFFLEAGFLGIMLFGLANVGPRLHFAATLMVAAGTLFSAFWILSANSWMQTPAGYGTNAAGQFVPKDWLAIVFNPSFPYRLVHMVLAAYLTTAFVVGAVGAWHLLRDAQSRAARVMFSMALWMALCIAPLQILAGDQQGLNTLKYQPRKIAAMEGHWQTEAGAPLILFGIPDDKAEKTSYRLEIPHGSALILTHSYNGVLKGLKAWPKKDRPSMEIVFWSFRIMVGLGFLMLGIGLWGAVQRWRGGLYGDRWLARASVLMGPSGLIAVLAGWVTTEVGRQPFTVYGLLRTADSAAPLAVPAVAASLAAFAIVYVLVFAAGVFYIVRLMKRSPDAGAAIEDIGPTRAAGITPAPAVDAARFVGGG